MNERRMDSSLLWIAMASCCASVFWVAAAGATDERPSFQEERASGYGGTENSVTRKKTKDAGKQAIPQKKRPEGKAGTAGKKERGASVGGNAADEEAVIYQNGSYTLTRSSIIEGNRQAYAKGGDRPTLFNCNAEMVRPHLARTYPIVRSPSAMLDTLYWVALADLEMNIVTDENGKCFRVSPDFPNMIFTRDVAYSSYLGACYVLPDIVKSHLRIDRELRRRLGFRCPESEVIPLPGINNEPEPVSNYEFFETHGTNAYARRTDDPCWVLGYWAAICAAGSREELPWLIGEFDFFDHAFYDHFLDPQDGLYFGQASFIDVGGTGYPPGYGIQDSLRIKALSTNCLYVAALDRIAKACDLCGQPGQATEYRRRAGDLRRRIEKTFLHPKGYYAYFKDFQGRLQDRREQLGSAFLVLFDVLDPRRFTAAVNEYPLNDFGSPTIYPFYGEAKVYHNNAIWPFADTLFHMALFKTHREKDVLLRTLGNLSRNALWGNFTEVMDYQTGGWTVKHARSYIWSAAAYLSVIFHMIAGVDAEEMTSVRFRPYLPEELGNSFQIENFRVAGMTLDIAICGNGGQIKRLVVDGRVVDQPVLDADGEDHMILIELGNQQPLRTSR